MRRCTPVLLAAMAAVLIAAPPALAQSPQAGGAADPERANGAAGGTFRDCPHCPEMVLARPGTFIMGGTSPRAADERPAHRVTIGRRLAYSKDKVSFRDWKHCVVAGLCQSLGASGSASLVPVVLLSWVDAQQYLVWLTLETGAEYRLLSEAEWEYLARSPATVAPGFRAAGLEWTSDCWHADYTHAPADGSSWDTDGDCRYHVARGHRPGEAAPSVTRRYRFLFTAGDAALGFRVARTMRD
jgi:formylglycine-generating enzyme required for sulfatase activity